MKRSTIDRIILVNLVVANVLFLAYWGILAFYSRLQNDDLHFLWVIRDTSIFDYTKNVYLATSGRFVGYLVNGLVLKVTNVVGFHQLWTLVYYVAGIGLCWFSVRDISLHVSRIGLFMGICFLYNLYILTNIDFPVFFWLCAMMYYLSFPMTCLLLKYLNLNSLNWRQVSVFVLLILLLGGVNETFTPLVLLLMLICGLYWWHKKEWKVKETWALPQVKRIVWTALALLVLWGIAIAAPGNYVRLEEGMAGEGFVHPIGLLDWIKSLARVMAMFFYFMAFYIPYYMVAFVLAYYVGTKSNYILPASKFKLLMILAVGFIVYLAISCLPDVYLYCNFRLQRNYTHAVFVWLLVVTIAGFVCGHNRSSWAPGKLAIVGVLILTVITCVNIINDAPTAKRYGKEFDERMEYLCESRDQGQKETVIVKPLPIPYTEDVKHFVLNKLGKDTPRTVLYYVSDAERVPNMYMNNIKHVLGLDFDFVLPPEECVCSE